MAPGPDDGTVSEVEAFLDETPGEVRGVVARNGRYEHLLMQRDDDTPQDRLGSRSIGRVVSVDAAFRAAFVDLGGKGAQGFLPLTKTVALKEGDRIEVEVVAEPRERKGPTLKHIGAGEGPPRLLAEGPDVRALLTHIAPGVEVQVGIVAIQAGQEAVEEALSDGGLYPAFGLDLSVQRTRALIAVDIDYAHIAGQDTRKARARANREGLKQAARLVRLKGWGGLVAVDLVGTGLDAGQITEAARAAFAPDAEVAFGPLSRFGLLQLSLPWRRTPIEERRNDAVARPSLQTRAIDIVRQLRLHALQDTRTPRFTARCAPQEAAAAAQLAAVLGPRAAVLADPEVATGRFIIEEI